MGNTRSGTAVMYFASKASKSASKGLLGSMKGIHVVWRAEDVVLERRKVESGGASWVRRATEKKNVSRTQSRGRDKVQLQALMMFLRGWFPSASDNICKG